MASRDITALTAAQAETVVRSTIAYVANSQSLANYDDLGFAAIEWVSIIDDVTTEICLELDGLQWTLPDYEPIDHDTPFPGPIAHWNCRSTQVPLATDPQTGELYGTPLPPEPDVAVEPPPDETQLLAAVPDIVEPQIVSVTTIPDERQTTKDLMVAGSFARSTTNGNRGINPSFIIELDNGEKGIFKPASGDEPMFRPSVPSPYYKNEIVVPRIAELIGVDDLVPPAVEKNFDFVDEAGTRWSGVGSFAKFVENATPSPAALDADKYGSSEDDLARSAAFDFLIGTTDRYPKNWMIARTPAQDIKLVLIDNGMTLPVNLRQFASGLVDEAAGGNPYSFPTFRPVPPKPLDIPSIVADWKDQWPTIEAYMQAENIPQDAINAMKNRLDLLNAFQSNHDDFATLLNYINNLPRGPQGAGFFDQPDTIPMP